MYYVLDIIPENNVVNEGTLFNVTIKSLGGTLIPGALVEFNDEMKLTDSNGVVNFTAPQVDVDIFYGITATKPDYTSANETILVKNQPAWVSNVLIFGLISNLTTSDNIITFDAIFVVTVIITPFNFTMYRSGERLTIADDYRGFVGARFILVFCKMLV
jgi:hypothetical protein